MKTSDVLRYACNNFCYGFGVSLLNRLKEVSYGIIQRINEKSRSENCPLTHLWLHDTWILPLIVIYSDTKRYNRASQTKPKNNLHGNGFHGITNYTVSCFSLRVYHCFLWNRKTISLLSGWPLMTSLLSFIINANLPLSN